MEYSDVFVSTFMKWTGAFMRSSMQDFLLFAKQNGLSMTQISALFLISHKDTSSVSDIGGELDVTTPAASQLLDRLVQQGLVDRCEDPHDRRLKQITLSEQGKVLLQKGIQSRQKWLESLEQLMTLEEQNQVIEALTLMLGKVQQLEVPSTQSAQSPRDPQ
jgi:DNA-binding MarR family transcriptional regulator